MIAATLMLVLAAPPRPGDLDVEYVPVDHPSPAYVEALLRTLGERNPAPAEVDRLASFFLESHSNSFSAVCRLSTSSFWRPRSERILTAANGRRPAPAEIVEFHAELDPTADEAEEIAGLKAQASSPRAVVRGIVTDADDRPVAGALLTGDLGFEPVRTDEQGRYSSRARLKQGEYVTLNVSAEGHAAGGGDTAPWNEHDSLVFDIKLRRPRTVRLTLRDEHKQPIELAAVTLSVKETTLKGVAGPDGVATFTNAPALDEDSSDEANVEILRRGFPAHRQSAKGFVAGSLEITVPPFKPLRGRVLRENGKPAGGAWVQSRNRRNPDLEFGTYADDEGRFLLGISRESRELVAELPGMTIALPLVEKPPADDSEWVLRAAPGDFFEGVVLDAAGKPAAGASLTLRCAEESDFGRSPSLRAFSDGQGRFRLGPARHDVKYDLASTLEKGEDVWRGVLRSAAGDRDLEIRLARAKN